MDKKLLVDLSKIIREVESKNLFKEADTLNNCLVRLAQMAEENAPTEEQKTQLTDAADDLEAATPVENINEPTYSNAFLTELMDFTIKSETATKKLKDFMARGEMPTDDFKTSVEQLLVQANKLISMNEAQGEEKTKLTSMVESLNFLKNIF